jgi:rod shape-determining protein MreC
MQRLSQPFVCVGAARSAVGLGGTIGGWPLYCSQADVGRADCPVIRQEGNRRSAPRQSLSPFLRKHRELLVVGGLLSFAFLSYASNAGQPAVPGPIRRTVVWMTSPIERGLVATVSAAQDVWYGYIDLRAVRERNLKLEAEVIHLKSEQAKLAETQAENERLRKMATFSESMPDIRLIAAPVIAFGADPKLKSIRIGRGSADGLRPGLPVVTPEGVVGRVTQVYDTASDVLLIIDPTSAVAAITQKTRARATARGTGDVGLIRLDFIAKSEVIEEGDILLTAPSGTLFPKGLLLGRATGVEPKPGAEGLFKRAMLKAAVQFDRLEEVQVIVDRAPSASLDLPMNAVVR